MGDFGAPGRPQDAKPSSGHLVLFGLLAEMTAPRVEFGPQLGRPGGPKSHFLAKSQHKIVKKSFQEGFQKKHEKIINK